MASPMRAVCSIKSLVCKLSCTGLNAAGRCSAPAVSFTIKRTLFSDEILGIEGYKKYRSYTLERMGSMKDTFRTKMDQYLHSAEDTVFSDDLKTLLNIAETKSDIQLALRMLRVYLEQDTYRFNTFQFGPVLMRVLHMLKQPQIALDIYNDPVFTSLFDQVSSCLNLVDNLYVNGRHDDVIAVFLRLLEKFGGGERFPRDCITIFAASCLQKGTPDAYQTLLNFLSEFKKSDMIPPDKACAISAYLALNQKDPKTAVELASSVRWTEGAGPLNIRAQAYAALDRPLDALNLLTTVLYKDAPQYATTRQDIFSETLDVIGEVVERHDKTEMSTKFNIVCNDLTRTDHVTQQSLRDYLLQPVVRRQQMKAGFKSRQRSPADDYQRSDNVVRRRRGLTEE